ncbi:aspartate dehydrogenase [Klebsiella oxytoca]|uniref:L-aspartate dehydrogenase n=1 Tax=Klebsiella oxytoca TaxID=571 RepID=A0A6B8N1G6_KLEOX|nr:aspartate dehydrogenase [Klebsiella oxytoca]QGN39697.1 aspartate dehydrogenase [Klebsiella oxytoca]
MKKVMLIGYGAMAQAVIERLPPQVSLGWIVAREPHHEAIRQQFANAVVALSDPQQCDETPDLVLECASQQAVAQYGEAVLARGWHLAVISTGALADSELEQRLRQAGGKLTLLSGAIAGIDGLAAAKEGGLERVTYQSRKSPASWRGSYAEQLIDLNAVNETQIFFEGSAREAARLFPANANVAATVALGGIGLDATRVQLMVDPATQRNTHTLHAEGLFGEFHLELSGLPLASNPKTSTLAALSAVRACCELA